MSGLPMRIGFGFSYTRANPDISAIASTALLDWWRTDSGLVDGSGAAITNGTAARDWTGYNGGVTTQGTAANRPTWTAADSAGNSRPSLTYDSTDYFQNSSSNLVTAGSAYWVFFVGKASSTAGGPMFTSRIGTKYWSTCFLNTNCYVAGNGADAAANITIADPAKTSLFWSVHQWNGNGFNPTVYFNGVSQAITSGVPPSSQQITETGTTGYMIGGNSAGQRWFGKMWDLAVVNGTITAGQLSQLASYVSGRYAL